MNLGSENGPLTPALSPKGERVETSRNLHQVQGFNARILRGILSPFGGEREKRQADARQRVPTGFRGSIHAKNRKEAFHEPGNMNPEIGCRGRHSP